MNSGIPIFPTMIPNTVNQLWFSVDEPKNEETELIQIESIHQNWVRLTVILPSLDLTNVREVSYLCN
jgi:hypothetical protein